MGLITVSGEPGSRYEEAARLASQRLHFELITQAWLERRLGEAYPEGIPPATAWPHLATSILARLATEHHLVLTVDGAEFLFPSLDGVLRARLVESPARRVGALMIDRRLDRSSARELFKQLEKETRARRRAQTGRATAPETQYDVTLNADSLSSDQIAEMICHAACTKGVAEEGLLPFSSEAPLQFYARLCLARHGIAAPGVATLRRRQFNHSSEEIFANLLDFYRIAWDYEPRSFPVRWDDGKVIEAFTPDFYLPEFDLYIELTTMKQSLVTRKNRKVKLLRSIYPDINIQVFYQKDFQNLIFKYGLSERPVPA